MRSFTKSLSNLEENLYQNFCTHRHTRGIIGSMIIPGGLILSIRGENRENNEPNSLIDYLFTFGCEFIKYGSLIEWYFKS